MFRILLADDEGIMLEFLKRIIAISFESECDIRCVKTSRAVAEVTESFHPDIAFVDIHMPGLNGIQAIREIRRVSNEMTIIIITTYDKLVYVRETVNLSVMEYLTKPVSNKKMILDVCMKAMQWVEEAKQKQSDDLKTREGLEVVVLMIRSGLIYSMSRDGGAADGSGYEKLLGIRDSYGFHLVLEFGDRDESGRLTNAVGSSVKANKCYQDMGEIVKDYFSYITGPAMGNWVVLFVPSSEPTPRYEERVEVITRIRIMLQKPEKHIGSDFCNDIGNTKTLGSVKESYREALRALWENISHVVHVTDISSRQGGVTGEYPKELENSYYGRGLRADSEGTAAYGAELFSCIEGMYRCREDVEAKILEFVMRSEYRVCVKSGTELGMKPRGSYIRETRGASDSDKLCRWFLEKTREICKYAGTEREREMECLMDTVRRYTDENHQKDISLDEISRAINISPYYSSKLFKQGTGENFIEYLTRIKVRQAYVCLQNLDYNIKQICTMVGYGDPNYFSHIFRKYEGVNPGEYRERLGNGTGRGQGIDISICKRGATGCIVCVLSMAPSTALAVSGCVRMEDAVAGSMEQEELKVQIGLSFDSFVIERWVWERDVLISAIKELRVEANVWDANGDVQNQIPQIEYFIKKQVDVIVAVVGDCEALADMMIRVKEAGIKTTSYGRLIQNAGCDLYISSDNTRVSKPMVRNLLESIPGRRDIFLIQGPLTDHNITLIHEGIDEMLADSSLNVVCKSNCADWVAESAYTYVKEELKQNRYVKGIICGNNDPTSQAFRALSEKRLVGKVYVTGQDGNLAAYQRIAGETQEITAFESVEQKTSMAVRYTVLLGLGEEIEEVRSTVYDGAYQIPYLGLQPIAVTGESMDEVIIKGGFHVKGDMYLNVN